MSHSNTKYYRAKAFVFDLAGTLIDTTPLVNRFWRQFALENGVDGDKILATSHGVRTIETMAKWTPHRATEEHAQDFERKLAEDSDGVSLLPGVSTLLQKLPHGKWAICTAGNSYMAKKRLEQCDIDLPEVLVCGDMVSHGKPHPEPYLKAIEKLGFKPEEVIIFEDAPAGVKSAKAAGAQVIACKTTHSLEQLKEAGAHEVIELLTDIDFVTLPDASFEVQVKNTL
ncbi:HAD-superfamily hydrolase subfamily IA, variant 3 [Gilbertella persicaria]|uniref:HAD-superfamily hydrolase subfamily IA, variant 3 n=1 Tax=Gilbertella persicaria TaxID=101096 RepID=UPI002220F4E3|nr:HAD-superfamily hydrolase subfamily IA, variant 3 [Gilbertella persicaria]KAI8052594.1 HAD-superfamily hydrolase subfamily IA, variant 3 [Gilbertella persicaria]